MIVWTHAVLGVLCTCVLYFCICTCSVQLNMFHLERCSRNTLIIIMIIIIINSLITKSIGSDDRGGAHQSIVAFFSEHMGYYLD